MRRGVRRRGRRVLLVLLGAMLVLSGGCVADDPAIRIEGAPPTGPVVAATPTPAPTAAPTSPSPRPTVTRTSEPAAAPSPTPAPTTPRPPPPPTQLRGVWVHLFDDTLKTPGSIDRMLDRVAASGANTVIAEVVRRQDAYYDSDVLPRAVDPALPDGFDPLAHLVDGAHARGLDLHAWIPVTPAYHRVYDALPSPDRWVWSRHGAGAPADQRWVTRTADGTWGDHLDPGHPAVRRHIVEMVTEVARRYDVDAMHLDYLRYPARDAGYNPAALARFRAETGRTGVPAPDDGRFSAWRREQTRSLLAAVRRSVAEVAPTVGISAAVIAQGEGPGGGRGFAGTRGYAEYFQDWPDWVRSGLLDAAMPMAYFRSAEHGAWFDGWIRFARGVARRSDVVVAPGVAGYLNIPDAGRAQLAAAMRGTDGTVVYSYQQSASTAPHSRLLAGLSDGLWRTRARAPDLR